RAGGSAHPPSPYGSHGEVGRGPHRGRPGSLGAGPARNLGPRRRRAARSGGAGTGEPGEVAHGGGGRGPGGGGGGGCGRGGAGPGTRAWKFSGRNGEPWGATMSIEPKARGSHEYTMKLSLARSG